MAASLFPNLSPSLLPPTRRNSISSSASALRLPRTSISNSAISTSAPPSTKLDPPPPPDKAPPDAQDKKRKDDFYLNVGTAVRTLREDLPLLFTKDLDYDIYRSSFFLSPRNMCSSSSNSFSFIFWCLKIMLSNIFFGIL
ncbi:hypothetical protein ACLOJK_041482 [Asimina triloba]